MVYWRRPIGRSDVIAKSGIVATSQPLATQAGISILKKGGNAIDAAIAAAAVLDVVEPMSTGCGGDAFALIHKPNRTTPLCFNGSGRSGSLATLEDLLEMKWTNMPLRGGPTVTVPGAMHLWCMLVEELGTMELNEVFADAIHYARDGFPVSPIISESWQSSTSVLRNDTARETFMINGRGPKCGETMNNRYLADLFELVSNEGAAAFYTGKVAEAIVETVQDDGGFLTLQDLENHETEETKPISTDYHGVTVFEHPPNGQGFAALLMLNIMQCFPLNTYSPLDAERIHIMVEAKKLAYTDLFAYNSDPDFYDIPLDKILSKDYAFRKSQHIQMSVAMEPPPPGQLFDDDTIYLATADKDGFAVSFINSLYYGFGSGLVVPKYGIKLQCRGNLFSLDPEHPNCYAPRKRPFHTIIPGALYDDDSFLGVFGIMGALHQSQAHAQFVSNIVDHKMSPQEALDYPRFNHVQERNVLALENGFPPSVQGQIRKKGHKLIHETMSLFGGGQAILRLNDVWIGGSDKRKDGQAAGY